MAERPLSERERELLFFLLSAPGIPDVDVFRRQAEAAVVERCQSFEVDIAIAGSAVPPQHAAEQAPMRHPEPGRDDLGGIHD
jgi:hypothetical protein